MEQFLSASMVICEKVLNEQDGVLSAIRIVDVFYVQEIPKEITEIEGLAIMEASIILAIRVSPPTQSERILSLKISHPNGETKEIFSKPVSLAGNPLIPKDSDVPRGTTLHIRLALTKRILGTYIVRAFLDGEEIAKSPFTLLPPVQQKDVEH